MPLAPTRADWMALAVGALEPGDAATLLSAGGPAATLRLATLRALAGLPDDPDLALPSWPIRTRVGPAPLLSADDDLAPTVELVRAGERVRIQIVPPRPPDQLRPLIWRVAGEDVLRLLPTSVAPWPTLDRFFEVAGARVVDLVAAPPYGPQLLVLGLLSADEVEEAWPPEDPRDERVRRAVLEGRLPGSTHPIVVV